MWAASTLSLRRFKHSWRPCRLQTLSGCWQPTRNRIRSIVMSTLTSVFGVLPLVLFPGAGSELHRGLGSVVVGGLSLSAVLTLLLIPPLLTMLVGPPAKRPAWPSRPRASSGGGNSDLEGKATGCYAASWAKRNMVRAWLASTSWRFRALGYRERARLAVEIRTDGGPLLGPKLMCIGHGWDGDT